MKWTRMCSCFAWLLVMPMPHVLSQAGAGQTAELQKTLSGFRTFYEKGLRENSIVGSSAMIITDGEVIAKNFHGMADLEKNRPVDADTIYHWASITKTLTGIAIMQLRDRGLLRLEDPILKYIPELKQVHDPFGDMSEITLRHLMTHSSGFRSATWPWGGSQPWHPHEPTRWEQLAAMFPYTEILFKPGSKYSYSNPGIIFLGRVIELLSGDDYEVYIDKNIFKPLEMHRSYFDATPYHLLPQRSASYWVRDGRTKPARFDVDTGITVSNGGLNAPLPDMVKYLNFLSGIPARQAVYDGVLKRSSLEEMFQPQISASTAPNEKVSMGLIFFVEEHNGMQFIAHSGSQNAFISHFYLHLPSRSSYIVAFNTEWEPAVKTEAERTRALDRALRDYLAKNLFPLLGHR
jgi:CubicO group peptidase (beta-lactamase class C family)